MYIKVGSYLHVLDIRRVRSDSLPYWEREREMQWRQWTRLGLNFRPFLMNRDKNCGQFWFPEITLTFNKHKLGETMFLLFQMVNKSHVVNMGRPISVISSRSTENCHRTRGTVQPHWLWYGVKHYWECCQNCLKIVYTVVLLRDLNGRKHISCYRYHGIYSW